MRRRSRKVFCHLKPGPFLAFLLAITGVVVVAPAGSAGAVVTETVDCAALLNGGVTAATFVWAPSAETVSVTMTNCGGADSDYEVVDIDYNTVSSGTADQTASVAAGNTLMIFGNGPFVFVIVDFLRAYPETVPAGERQIVSDVELPASALEMTVGGVGFTPGTEHSLGGISTCDVLAGPHVYATVEISVTTAGTYTFRGVSTNPVSDYVSPTGADHPIGDPFLALYGTLDPADPDAGVIGCNDDLNDLFGYDNNEMGEVLSDGSIMEGHLPYFTATLDPGTYTLVLMLWQDLGTTDWAADAPGSVKFEMWGPAGSLCVIGAPGCASDGFDCAATPFFHVINGRLFGKTTPTAAGTAIGERTANFNAMAFDPTSKTLYAWREGTLLNITPNGVTVVGAVKNLPSASYPAADLDPATGRYYIGGPQSGLFFVDLTTRVATRIKVPSSFGQVGLDIVIRNGWLWTIDADGRLKGLNLSTKAVKSAATTATGGIGALWQTGPNQFTAWRNGTGDFFRISGVGTSKVVTERGPKRPRASVTDAANCRTPVA